MAIPIKERGIQWVESYSGEKSAHLKKEMDSQIGPGAYCRWEGHDPVTGNDYYVVVSPGFSKKRGFHFFAGLRKMPADHGASGKKFSNQREAMSHARETWQVPPPKDKPLTTQGYGINEIRNAPILREIHHKGESSGWVVKTATPLNSLGVGEPNIKRREGYRATTEVLCYAYGAAPLLGMYPAILSRPRFLAVDVTNVPAGRVVFNEFTGKNEPMSKDEGLTPAPSFATYESPTPEDFQKAIKGVWTENKLVSIGTKSSKRVKSKVVLRSEPYADAPEPGNYNTVTWRNLRLTPVIEFSKADYHETAPLWRDLLTTFGGWKPREKYWNPRDPKPKKDQEGKLPDFEITTPNYIGLMRENNLDRVQIRVEMAPEIYDEVMKRVSAPPFHGKIKVSNNIQKTLIAVRDIEKENFNWDEVFFESIKMTGSRLLRYDDAGLPYGISPVHQGYTEEEAESEVGKDPKYLVRDPYDLIAPYVCEDLAKLGMLHELMYLVNYKPNGWMAKATAVATAIRDAKWAAIVVQGASTPEGLSHLNGKAQAKMNKFVESISSQAWEGTALEDEAGLKLEAGIDALVASRSEGNQPGMVSALSGIKHYLMGFQWLAAAGKVGFSHEQFVHSHTASPHLTDYKPVGLDAPYDLDEMRIPRGASLEGDSSQEIGRAEGASYAPPFVVPFPTVQHGQEYVYAGCHYDSEKKQWMFGRLPEGVSPHQENLKGMHTIIKDTSLITISKNGRPHVLKGGQATRFRTAPREDGNDAIVGGCYDFIIAPEGASSQGGDEYMVGNAMSRFGFGLWTQNHAVYEPSIGGVGKKSGTPLRQHKSDSLLKADPRSSPELYRGVDPDGTEWDVSDKAFKTPNGIFFEDNISAARVLAKTTHKSLRDLGPITPVSIDDQRMIDANQREAMEYSNSIDLYESEKKDNSHGFFQGENLVPPTEGADEATLELYQAVSEGMENARNKDDKLYEYGKNCRLCGKELNANRHVRIAFREAVKEAIKDPAKAFERKTREVFCLSYADVVDDPSGQHQVEVDLTDDNGKAVIFGSLKDAEKHLPAFQAIPENQSKVLYVRSMGEQTFPYAMRENPEAQYEGFEQFEKHVRGKYPRKAQAPDSAPAPAPVQVPTQVVPVVPQTAPAGEDVEAPEQQAPPIPPIPPPAQPAQKPKSTLPPPPKLPKASVLQRLVALADKLDSSGKKGEADAIDRILGTTCRSQ